MTTEPEKEHPVRTDNEFGVIQGENMPNHTTSLQGRGRFIQITRSPVVLRTKQEVLRLCAWLESMAEVLPDEFGDHTYEEILEAIQALS